MAASPLSLKARALQWLAGREYSRVEMQRKLLRLARAQQTASANASAAGGEDDDAHGRKGPASGWGGHAQGHGPRGRDDDHGVDEPDQAHAEGPAGVDIAAEVDAVVDWLVAQRYLSDERFVESRVNARSARHGNMRIRHELGQHGATLDAATAERLQHSELARASAVWARKFGNAPAAATASERARQMRFLAGRGFSADVVRKVVREAGAVPEEAD